MRWYILLTVCAILSCDSSGEFVSVGGENIDKVRVISGWSVSLWLQPGTSLNSVLNEELFGPFIPEQKIDQECRVETTLSNVKWVRTRASSGGEVTHYKWRLTVYPKVAMREYIGADVLEFIDSDTREISIVGSDGLSMVQMFLKRGEVDRLIYIRSNREMEDLDGTRLCTE